MTDLQGRILSSWLFSFGWDGPCVVPFQYCVRQPRPPFKIAAVTKNRNFFNFPLLLYHINQNVLKF